MAKFRNEINEQVDELLEMMRTFIQKEGECSPVMMVHHSDGRVGIATLGNIPKEAWRGLVSELFVQMDVDFVLLGFESWISSRETSDLSKIIAPSQDPNRMEALTLLVYENRQTIGNVIQMFKRTGNKFVFLDKQETVLEEDDVGMQGRLSLSKDDFN